MCLIGLLGMKRGRVGGQSIPQLEQEKTECFCDGSGVVYRVAVVATLNDGRGSVGLVDPDGEMIVLNEGEVKLRCRLVEVAVMQTSTLAVLDCGQGEVPYRIGDELRLAQ
jgi:hypothetical protein